MKFPIDVQDIEVPQLLNSLMQITGVEAWIRRFKWLQRESEGNYLMKEWLRERCSIEWAFCEVLGSGVLAQQLPFKVETIGQYELVAFAAAVVRSYQLLSESGKRRLRGVLLDGLKEDKGLSSVQHEMATVVHLMRRGFDVQFHDLEHGAGFDFMARKNEIEIEVECKMFSADLGRKIHRRRSATLCKSLEGVLHQTYKSAKSGMIIVITIPDRLTPSPQQHLEIEKALRSGVLSGTALTQTEYCDIRVLDFSMENSPFHKRPEELSQEEIQKFVREQTNRSNSTVMLMVSPGQRAIVLSLASKKPDDVLGGMRRQLRDAAKGQFTKTRAAFLSVQLHDLSADQLADVARSDSTWRGNATGLQIMTSDFFQSPSRAHIHSVVYRSQGKLNEDHQIGNQGADSLAYLIKNGNHPLRNDPQYSVFGS